MVGDSVISDDDWQTGYDMTLLEALCAAVKDYPLPCVRNSLGVESQMVIFAFADKENAFLSEIETEELVPLLEEWCRQQRLEMGSVH
jgi:hypothetical protein